MVIRELHWENLGENVYIMSGTGIALLGWRLTIGNPTPKEYWFQVNIGVHGISANYDVETEKIKFEGDLKLASQLHAAKRFVEQVPGLPTGYLKNLELLFSKLVENEDKKSVANFTFN